jgi:hypothetical protein
MIMEHIECDKWYTHDVDGKNGSVAAFGTSWAFEFMTDVARLELWIRVPDTLDMYEANSTALENATLCYTSDHWINTTTVAMAVSNMTCNATIPQQEAGSFVEYAVQAVDTLKNNLTATGDFTVKHPSSIADFNSTQKTVLLGENVTVTGTLEPPAANNSITIQFMSANATETINCLTFENGTFTGSFQPETTGIWAAQASFSGSDTVYECESGMVLVTVEEQSFLAANGLFIGAGAGGAGVAAGVVVYFKKFRQ